MAEKSSDLARLVHIRGSNRGVVTKFVNEAELILSKGRIGDTDLHRLETLSLELDGKRKLLERLDQDVLQLASLADIEREVEKSSEINTRISDVTLRMSRLITRDCETPSPRRKAGNQGLFNFSFEHSESSLNSSSSGAKAKLPKLQLPHFKGEVTRWSSFWDSFESSVHNNIEISEIDKFNYLKSLLEGEALRAVQGLPLTSANYESAVTILKDRYGRPQLVITAHMEEILKIPECQSVEKVTQLRFIFDQLNIHVRGLQALGVDSYQYGSLLIPIIMSKLPAEIRLIITRKTEKDVWQINEILELLKSEVEAREVSVKVKINEGSENNYRRLSSERKPFNTTPRQQPSYSTTSSFFTKADTNNKMSVKCAFCGQQHYSASCETVNNVSKRKEILIKDRRCFVCLKVGHRANACTRTTNCRKCRGRHHQSVCNQENYLSLNRANTGTTGSTYNFSQSGEGARGGTVTQQQSSFTGTVNYNVSAESNCVLLQTAIAYARSDSEVEPVEVKVLFDSGSQRSYITQELKDKLNLKPTRTETLNLNTFGDNSYRRQKCDLVKLSLSKTSGREISVNALTFPTICSKLPMSVEIQQYPHLQNLELADNPSHNHKPIDVLIGSDHYWHFINGNVIKGESGPVAVESELGWILSGVAENRKPESRCINTVTNLIIDMSTDAPDDDLTNQLKTFWQTETIGIYDNMDDNSDVPSNEDFLEIKHDGTRYSVKLPWKPDCSQLPDHYDLCRNRLLSLHKRLKKHSELHVATEYDSIIREQLKSGIIEQVERTNKEQTTNIHYMPHHAVIREDRSTTKLRIVYDGSAHLNEDVASINSCLEQGPNLMPLLFDILLRFRQRPIAMAADIEKAFLMVEIDPSDRDALRFLWFVNVHDEEPKIVEYRFCRLVFGLKPSPAILGATILHHLSNYNDIDSETAKTLKEDLYVDDLTTGAETVTEAINTYNTSKRIMKEGGFNLRKWVTNSSELRQHIMENEHSLNTEQNNVDSTKSEHKVSEDDQSYTKSTLNSIVASNDNVVKVLGVHWDTQTDMFLYDFTDLINYAQSLKPTKRSFLQLSARIFDPLGLITPFTITLKILFQILCIDKLSWDEDLSEELKSKWQTLINGLKELNNLRVPRCYFPAQSQCRHIEFHGFCDASVKAYAALVYLRVVYDDHVKITLLCSRSRVAPLKQQSIPRLELLGALLLSRLMNSVQSALKGRLNVNDIYYWTDSTTVLCWVRNQKHWKQYVQHRVDEIHKLTSAASWRHCAGQLNPADLPSRGIPSYQLIYSSLWWNGPQFLQQPEEMWPVTSTSSVEDDLHATKETVKVPVPTTHIFTNTRGVSSNINVVQRVDKVMTCQNYNNLSRLLRITAYVLRFINNSKKRRKDKLQESNKVQIIPTADEIQQAELQWVLSIQLDSFSKEIEALDKVSDVSASSVPLVRQFNLFIDELGVLRCKGRLDNSSVSPATNNPILLPNKHFFTKLVVNEVHHQVNHSGLRVTLTTLREKYWVPRGRALVKDFIKHCIICTRYSGKPFAMENPPSLPEMRVDDGPPFSNTGVDYAGPLYVKDINLKQEDNTCSKVYVALFTCAATRAVHLELVPDCSADSFLFAFRRFSSRRGLPYRMISDNAKNFKASQKIIQKIARSQVVQSYLSKKEVRWDFIVEKAPWWGGFWERLIGVTKDCIKRAVGRAQLTFEELRTILIEAEGIVNSRPLTYIYDDTEGISYTLSPSHLIYGRRITPLPSGEHFDITSTNQSLTRRARYHKQVLQHFTTQWKREYLTSLRENAKVYNKRNNKEIAVGDIVILKREGTARCFWKLAVVKNLLPGKDGKVRAAEIRVLNSSTKAKPTTLKRPLQALVQTEVKANLDEETLNNSSKRKPCKSKENEPVTTKSLRKAAVLGEMRRRENK